LFVLTPSVSYRLFLQGERLANAATSLEEGGNDRSFNCPYEIFALQYMVSEEIFLPAVQKIFHSRITIAA